jgi:pyridoxal phosphate enzyme (YggS family)
MLSKDVLSQKLLSLQSQLKGSHLLIVSKTRSEDEIRSYYDLGHRDFGENRVQELQEKAEHLSSVCPDIRWHMIGHLQSNKINQLFSIPNLWAVHSVDDAELLSKLMKAQTRLAKELRLFLQFNTSREEEKSGFENYESLKSAALSMTGSTKLRLQGLMTMGTLRTENFQDEARRCFRELQDLKNRLESELQQKLETSMGMSQDYQIALEERSDWIRLGTMMFT